LDHEEIAMFSPHTKSVLIGAAIGAGMGTIPGLFSATVGSLLTFLQAAVYTQNASSLVVYLGILIGGAAGAVVAALGATNGVAEAIPAEQHQSH
jgi:Na+/phosphate symporter